MRSKSKSTYNYKPKRKRSGKGLTIVLLISGIIMTGLVTWTGMNNWNLEKSFGKIVEQIGLIDPKENETIEPVTETEIPVDEEEIVLEGEELEKMPVQSDLIDEKEPDSLPVVDAGGYIVDQELPVKETYIKGILVASKKYPLPSTFAPGESLEGRAKFEELAAESALLGFKLTAFSTYRSYEYQTGLYQRYVDKDGSEKADRYSARPGYSEHQTGLAFDIGEVNQEKLWLTAEFGDSPAGKWLAENAHRYGFILRYPLGKEEITGYMYESWHYRYVGVEVAEQIYNQMGTLEEYLDI